MRFCSACGEVIKDDEKYCKNCGHKNAKKRNMLLYFISMIILFILFDVVSKFIYSNVYEVIQLSRFGVYFIVESIWAAVVFAMMIIAGNKYIFYRKKENFWKSVGLAVFPLIVSIIGLLTNLSPAIDFNFVDVLCLVLYCFTIGLVEEFMCRGWILTEFIERYGYDRKHVRLAILCSALVFGFMHITNIGAGQSVFETICQIIQTIGSGYLFGAIFYRTRNIWACVFIHAFYDFSIFLSEIGIYNACTYGDMNTTMMITSLITSIALAAIYYISGEILIRPSKVNHLLPKKKELTKEEFDISEKIYKVGTIFVIIFTVVLFVTPVTEYEGYSDCKTYPTKEISDNFYIKKYIIKKYDITYNDYSISIKPKGNDSLVITNNNTKYSKTITLSENSKFIVIKNNNYFAITLYDREEGKIIYKQIKYYDITDDNSFIDNLMDGSKEYVAPSIKNIGTILFDNSNEEFVYFESEEMPNIMIDSDSELYELVIN